ncbi:MULTISPECIES: hypothetical protein [unclassified Microbacterium]|uniref:hypothetical protein n=1 Tax=unclassified Microbacterium TaxID=2609290 RepID=UPI0021A41563|nr:MULTISPECIES: hypothetical protein [unclassified Microbacterium]MCT1364073.1 hypothetical protein [Microbacterium sp. p3-SID131]MCT1375285.1 hypothetical protein [Microbacterium sp. p3-SID337]
MTEQLTPSPETVDVDMPTDLAVEDDEYILRALSSDDVNGAKRVRWQAVAPRATEESASVMRLRLMGADKAKKKALEIKGAKYCGFGRALAETFREHAREVVDSRRHYYGHADLEHGFPRPPADPPPPPGAPVPSSGAYRDAIKHYRAIANNLCFFEDTPTPEAWSGADLEEACAEEGCEPTCTHPVPADSH